MERMKRNPSKEIRFIRWWKGSFQRKKYWEIFFGGLGGNRDAITKKSQNNNLFGNIFLIFDLGLSHPCCNKPREVIPLSCLQKVIHCNNTDSVFNVFILRMYNGYISPHEQMKNIRHRGNKKAWFLEAQCLFRCQMKALEAWSFPIRI